MRVLRLMDGTGLIYDEDHAITYWVEQRTPAKYSRIARAIGFMGKDGKVKGGAVFDNYRPAYKDIEFSFAGDGLWASRPAMAAMFHYAFGILGCNRATAHVHEDNEKAQRFLTKRLGFKPEGRQREMYPDGKDAILFGLLKHQIPEWVGSYNVIRSA